MSERKCALSFQWENLRKTDYLEGIGVYDDDDDDDDDDNNNNNHHHHHRANVVLGHLLTLSVLTHLKKTL